MDLLRYGYVYHLQNGYGDGYLDSCGAASCTAGTQYGVYTHVEPNRDGAGTGTWKILSAAGKTSTGQPVRVGDKLHIQNGYGDGYLDSCGAASCTAGTQYGVYTHVEPNRDGAGTGTWKSIVPEYPRWDYSGFPVLRASTLANQKNSQSLIKSIANSSHLHLQHYEWEPYCQKPGYGRPVFRYAIGDPQFDELFNSPAGLRGQYFLSPESGDAFTHNFIRAILKHLVDEMRNSDPDNAFIGTKSLKSTYAKVWMNETEGLPNGSDQSFALDRWVTYGNATDSDAIVSLLKISASEIRARVKWGRFAPIRAGIKIMGAWVNSSGQVLTSTDPDFPPTKITRSLQISLLGFS